MLSSINIDFKVNLYFGNHPSSFSYSYVVLNTFKHTRIQYCFVLKNSFIVSFQSRVFDNFLNFCLFTFISYFVLSSVNISCVYFSEVFLLLSDVFICISNISLQLNSISLVRIFPSLLRFSRNVLFFSKDPGLKSLLSPVVQSLPPCSESTLEVRQRQLVPVGRLYGLKTLICGVQFLLCSKSTIQILKVFPFVCEYIIVYIHNLSKIKSCLRTSGKGSKLTKQFIFIKLKQIVTITCKCI